jgi:hypothetical protein
MGKDVSINALFQVTRTEILERQLFKKENFADKAILAAIEAYSSQNSPKGRTLAFMKALQPLWDEYGKETCVEVFNEFVNIEAGIELFESQYSSHANHVIQEFMFGYNILLSCDDILTQYNYENGRNNPRSEFGLVFFSWMAASLLHDVGYDIEKAYKEEKFREKKNAFWNFMSPRQVSQPIAISEMGNTRELIEEQLLPQFKTQINDPNYSYTRFENLFKRKTQEAGNWIIYDHGMISALKYLCELKKLEEERHSGFLDWEPNKRATFAMAVHNFRYKEVNLRLSSSNSSTLIAYLLIISDEIQEWERERYDEIQDENDQEKETLLVGVSFKPTHAYVIIDHRLRDPEYTQAFEKALIDRIARQKEHYPISVQYQNFFKIIRVQRSKDWAKIQLANMLMGNSLVDLTSGVFQLTGDLLKFQKIVNVKTKKELLIPSTNRLYEIYVDHRINGEPFLVTVFPM